MGTAFVFDKLPAELHEMIGRLLEPEDILTYRLLNREAQHATSTLFIRAHFKKKGYTVTRHALDILDETANTEAFATQIEHIWINSDFLTQDCCPCSAETWLMARSTALPVTRRTGTCHRTPACHLYRYMAWEHNQLIRSGELRARLTLALGKLPHLRTIGIRKGKHTGLVGMNHLLTQSSTSSAVFSKIRQLGSGYADSTARLMSEVLHAAAASHRSIQHIYGDVIDTSRFKDCHRNQLQVTLRLLQPLFVSLQRVDLKLASAGEQYTCGRRLPQNETILPLLGMLTHVKDIGIVIPTVRPNNAIAAQSGLLYIYYAMVVLRHSTQRASFQGLRRLRFEGHLIAGVLIARLLRNSTHTLESLSIRDSTAYLTPLRPRAFNDWSALFHFLRTECEVLQHLHLHGLHYGGDDGYIEGTIDFSKVLPAHRAARAEDATTPQYSAQYHDIDLELRDAQAIQDALLVLENATIDTGYLTAARPREALWYIDSGDEPVDRPAYGPHFQNHIQGLQL